MGNLPRRTPIRDLHMAFKIPYLYDFVTKLCRKQATVILSHENANIRIICQGEARHGKYTHKSLEVGGGQAYDRSLIQAVVLCLRNTRIQTYKTWTAGLRG